MLEVFYLLQYRLQKYEIILYPPNLSVVFFLIQIICYGGMLCFSYSIDKFSSMCPRWYSTSPFDELNKITCCVHIVVMFFMNALLRILCKIILCELSLPCVASDTYHIQCTWCVSIHEPVVRMYQNRIVPSWLVRTNIIKNTHSRHFCYILGCRMKIREKLHDRSPSHFLHIPFCNTVSVFYGPFAPFYSSTPHFSKHVLLNSSSLTKPSFSASSTSSLNFSSE